MTGRREHYHQALLAAREALDELIDETPYLHDERVFVDKLAWAAHHARRGWYADR